MTDWPYSSSDSLLRRRREAAIRRRRRRRRVGGSLAVVCIALALAAVAVVLTSRSDHASHGREPRAAGVINVSRPAPPKPPNPESLAVDRVLHHQTFIRSGGGRHKLVALTFDDGPSPFSTRVMSVLAREQVPATFFQVGRMIAQFPAQAKQEVAGGYPIGNHTYAHPPLAALSAGAQATQVISGTAAMRRAGEPAPRLFRPPYLSYNSATLALVRRLRLLMILWSVDSQDYRQPGVSVIVSRVLRAVTPGGIVLMHDGGGVRSQTVAALPQIIRSLRARHYRFVTVPQLLVQDPPLAAIPHRRRHAKPKPPPIELSPVGLPSPPVTTGGP
ncbi:MAG: hypothetical protein NVSMB25_14110 [Thermoleophilaceae bacterium]